MRLGKLIYLFLRKHEMASNIKTGLLTLVDRLEYRAEEIGAMENKTEFVTTDPDALQVNDFLLDENDTEIQTIKIVTQSQDEVETVLALEKIYESLEALKNVGLSPAEAKVLNVTVQKHYTTLGYDHPCALNNPIFDNPQSRPWATSMVMEGMADIIENSVHRLLEYIRKILSYVYESLRSLSEGAQRLARQARTVQEQAKLIQNKTTPRPGMIIHDGTLIRFFNDGNQPLSPDEILPKYKKYLDTLSVGFSEHFLTQAAQQVGVAVQKAIDGKELSVVVSEVDRVLRYLKMQSFAALKKDDKLSQTTLEIYSAELPFAGKELRLELGVNADTKQYDSIRTVIVDGLSQAALPVNSTLKPLSHSHIVELARLVEDTMLFGIFKTHARTVDNLKRVEKAIERATEQITKMQLQSVSGEKGAMYSIHFLRDISSSLTEVVAGIHRYDVVCSKRLIDYMNASLKAYT